LGCADGGQQAQWAIGLGPVARDRVVGQGAQLINMSAMREYLKGADPQMACRNPCQHGTGQCALFAVNRVAG
jgi:hypothetical protein